MERGKYEAVQEYAEKQGKSVNALVVDMLDQTMSCTTAGTAAGGPQEAGVVSLPPDTLKAAQEAAQAAGEAVPVFIDRAVVTQAKRDEATRKLKGGVNHGH